MKNKNTLLSLALIGGAVVTAVGLSMAGNEVTDAGQANLLSGSEVAQVRFQFGPDDRIDESTGGETGEAQEVLDLLDVPTTTEAPDSPDFLNTFNVYKGGKSELELLARYEPLIKGDPSQVHQFFMPEILSFVDRIAHSDYVYDKLPMWPEFNIATVGNVLGYLFPDEPNPMLFAKGVGLVPLDAESHSYMSRAELMHMLGEIFLEQGVDPAAKLAELGFIDDAGRWSDTNKDGFLLVEAIRLVLDIRELLERSNIQESKADYAERLESLPEAGVVLSPESVDVMIKAFLAERSPSRTAGVVPKNLEKRMESWMNTGFGQPLTADLITEARNIFYEVYGESAPAVYELPAVQTIGNCSNEAFRKTYMGPVAVTGPLGAYIICDQIMVYFPANAYLLNIFSLPKMTPFQEQDGVQVVRTDVMRSYKNALVVNPEGEQRTRVFYRPTDLLSLVGASFGAVIADHDGNEVTQLVKQYTEAGAVAGLVLRSITGDNLISFEAQL